MAYPGDIVGLVNPGVFRIGDVVSLNPKVQLESFPRFTPEHFAGVSPKDVTKRKAFRKGLEQLAEEGVFEHRMLEEYGVPIVMYPASYKLVRWVAGETSVLARFARSVEDDMGRPVMLFRNSWDLDFAREQYEGLEFLPQPQDMTVIRKD